MTTTRTNNEDDELERVLARTPYFEDLEALEAWKRLHEAAYDDESAARV